MNQNYPGKNMPIQLKTALKILISTVLLFIYYYVQQLRAHSAGQGGKK